MQNGTFAEAVLSIPSSDMLVSPQFFLVGSGSSNILAGRLIPRSEIVRRFSVSNSGMSGACQFV
jgi:hypothetical protein